METELLLITEVCPLVHEEQNYFHWLVQYNVLHHITSYTQ